MAFNGFDYFYSGGTLLERYSPLSRSSGFSSLFPSVRLDYQAVGEQETTQQLTLTETGQTGGSGQLRPATLSVVRLVGEVSGTVFS